MKNISKDFRVGYEENVDLRKWPTVIKPFCKSKKSYKKLLHEHVEALSTRQRLHYAANRYALLLIIQGMDATGKDGAIRSVMSGVNLQSGEVFSFKQPSGGGKCSPIAEGQAVKRSGRRSARFKIL